MPKTTKTTKPTVKKEPKKLSDVDQLAHNLRELGCDTADVWRGDDNGLVYVRITKNGYTRIISVSEQTVSSTDTAKNIVSIARF